MIGLLVLAFFSYLIKRIISRVFDIGQDFFSFVVAWRKKREVGEDQLTGTPNNVEPKQTEVGKRSVKSDNKSEKKESIVNAKPKPTIANKEKEQPAKKLSLILEDSSKIEQNYQSQKPETKLEMPKDQSTKAAEQSNLSSKQSHSLKRPSSLIKDLPLERQQSKNSEQSISENKQKYFRTFQQLESSQNNLKDTKITSYQQTIEQLRRQIEAYKEEKKMYIERIEDIIQHVSQSQDQQVNEESTKNQDEELLAIRNLQIEINHAHQLEKEKEEEVAQQLQKNWNREKEQIQTNYEEQLLQLRTQLEVKRQEQMRLVAEFQSYRKDLQSQKSQIQGESKQENSQKYIIEIRKLKKELEQQKIASESTINQLKADLEALMNNSYDNGGEVNKLKDRLIEVENDKVEIEMKLITQNDSLKVRVSQLERTIKESFESQVIEEQKKEEEYKQKYNEYADKFTKELQETNNKHQNELDQQKTKFSKKLEEVQEQLRFCQEQIQQLQANENKLREELDNSLALPTPKRSEKSQLSCSQVQNHPQYLKVKSKLQTLQTQIKRNEKNESRIQQTSPRFEQISSNKVENIERKVNYARPLRERDPSPSFPSGIGREISSPGEVKSSSRIESHLSINSREKMNSVILAGIFDRRQPIRFQTPLDKPVTQSTVFQGGIIGETFFRQTNILNEKKRNFVIGEISRLKKITAKKTRLIYRSLAKNNKPITDYVSNVPNVFIVIELVNKKIIGAFTQTAFTKDLQQNSGQKSKYVSQNKSMIMDITNERVFANQKGHETIRLDSNALIWGRNELVINSEEPPLLSSDLNCESSIYTCDYSTAELLGANESSYPISQFEIFRVFLG